MARITTHPGEVLREEFMVPLGLSANALSRIGRAAKPDHRDHLSAAIADHGAAIADHVWPRA